VTNFHDTVLARGGLSISTVNYSASDVTAAVRNLLSSAHPNPADISTVTRCMAVSPESLTTLISDLNDVREDVKVTIVQQFFAHPDEASHRTSFDQAVVSDLLQSWFSISLGDYIGRPIGRFSQSDSARPARIQKFSFGPTQFFLYMTTEKYRVLDSLVSLLARDAVLTTDSTSPPCVVSEVTPLWLKEQRREPTDYYIGAAPAVDFDSFYASYAAAVRDAVGVTVQRQSRELALIMNGDGLRYHRDRLVNQYDAVARLALADVESTRLVQDLSLIDWDMQDGTFSGTVFVHPLGDRYIFLLERGNATSVFFSERPQLPGPMMMPYHCALPVQDSFAGSSVGESKGKRFSCLIRGTADAAEVDRLSGAAVPADINARSAVPGGFRFPNGMHIEQRAVPDSSLADSDASEYRAEQGCLVTRMSSRANSRLLDELGIRSSAGMYRLTRHGDGFGEVSELLPLADVRHIVVINRSINTPQPGVSYPLAVHLAELDSPVLQLVELPHGNALRVPVAVLKDLYLTPTSPMLHRSAPLDSFHPRASRTARMTCILDVILAKDTKTDPTRPAPRRLRDAIRPFRRKDHA